MSKRLCILLVFLAARPVLPQQFIGPHGYLTFEAEIGNRDSLARNGTFDLHHVNVLGHVLLNPKSRVFAEVEWEHKSSAETEGQPPTSDGFMRVERAWFEYAVSEALKLRVGKFLTPYGIYNEIHDAAPAFDTTILPQSVYGMHENPFGGRQVYYAEFAVGVQALGDIALGESNLHYSFLLSNGRGESPFSQDDNGNKGIGARLLADIPSFFLKVGYSFYTDRNGRAGHTRQTSNAWDIRFERDRWRLSSELAITRLGTEAGPSRIARAGYGEIAFHPFGKQTVLVRYDLFDANSRLGNDLEKDLTLGANVHLLPSILAKAEVHFQRVDGGPKENFFLAISSLAIVF